MSTIITLKVDDELKAQANAVLEELGLDAPTAIRMYLKSIVRENGLPINTKLQAKPCCCGTPTAVTTPVVKEAAAPVGKTVSADELFEEELPTPVVEEPTESVVEEEKADESLVPKDSSTENCEVCTLTDEKTLDLLNELWKKVKASD